MRNGMALGASVADIVLPSFDEEQLLWADKRPSDTIDRYRHHGASLVAVKNGEGQLQIWSQSDGIQTFQPKPVENLVDTTAAGDSFNAGLLCALLTGSDMEQAAHQAMDVSAQVISATGALVTLKEEKA